MKSYNKQLNEFIKYVLTKYKKNDKVQEFGEFYEKHQMEKLVKKEQRKSRKVVSKRITIEESTADLCKKLIDAEIEKNKILNMYSVEYIGSLIRSNDDLNGKVNLTTSNNDINVKGLKY